MKNINTPEYWNRVHKLTGEYRGTEAIYRLVASIAPPKASFVDLGCGCGWGQKVLRALGFNALGVDYSVEAQKLNHGILHDIQKPIPIVGGIFDIALMIMTLYCLDDPEAAIHESCKVLKPNGKLLVAQPEKHRWKEEFYYLPTSQELQELIHKRFKRVLVFNHEAWKIAVGTK